MCIFCRYGEGRPHRENKYRYDTDGSHYEKDDPRYDRRYDRRRNDRDRENYARYRDGRYHDRDNRDDWGKFLKIFASQKKQNQY